MYTRYHCWKVLQNTPQRDRICIFSYRSTWASATITKLATQAPAMIARVCARESRV